MYSGLEWQILYNGASEVFIMRKEVLLAIFIGLSLGLIITYGIYTARSSRRSPTATPTPGPVVDPLSSPFESTELIVTNPQDEIIQRDPDLTVTGTTWPNSFVVVVVKEREVITTADENGDFSVRVRLETGGNIITIVALNTDGRQVTQERTVTWAADEDLAEEESASPSPTARPTTRPTTSPSPANTP